MKKILIISALAFLALISAACSNFVSTFSDTGNLKYKTVTEYAASDLSFAVQADPHMDEQSDVNIYEQTLQNIVNNNLSFLIDVGDIFMIDKLTDKSETNIKNRYVLMKSYYDLLGSIPVYFAMGNHDGEAGWDTLNTKEYRLSYFPDQTYDKNY